MFSLSEEQLQRLRLSLRRLEVAVGVAAGPPVNKLDANAVLSRLICAERRLHAQRGAGLDAAASPTSGSLARLRTEPEDAAVRSAALSAAAAAVRAAPIETFLEEDEAVWEVLDGEALEPALRVDEALGGSPVRLVDARFLIELAERGGRLCRRQDLPEEAFVRPEALRRLPSGSGFSLRIMSISQ